MLVEALGAIAVAASRPHPNADGERLLGQRAVRELACVAIEVGGRRGEITRGKGATGAVEEA